MATAVADLHSVDLDEDRGSAYAHEARGDTMRVRKRSGKLEPVDVNKIVASVQRAAEGLPGVDPLAVCTRTIAGLADGTTTRELDELSIRTAAGFIVQEPNYSLLAARLLATCIYKEVNNQNLPWFSESVMRGHKLGLIGDSTARLVAEHSSTLNAIADPARDRLFGFFGLQTVYDRYLLRHMQTRQVIETPQWFFLRVACGLAVTVDDAIEFYDLLSSLSYMASSPTLFNSGTPRSQMSSCYLLDSPEDSLDGIYKSYTDIAKLSKYAGGIGVAWHRVRSTGSLIRGTNGLSNGVVPWLKTLDSSVAAVNQGGRRKGAACVYLEAWHADIEEFLELRENTGHHTRRAHNLNLANWIPDLFMERVERDADWSLFDPKRVPGLPDVYGDDFREMYEQAESDGLYTRQIPARHLYARMMRSLAETGNGWMCFKDTCNTKCNQTGGGEVVHLSNLCTEITEVTSLGETAVCNLGSINLAKCVSDGAFDFDYLGDVARRVVRFLDRVVDINFYPTDESEQSNRRWRPVGLGLMGLQDTFFQLRVAFDSPEAQRLNRRISETVYLNALRASTELAEQHGPCPAFGDTLTADGLLQFDLWGVEPSEGREQWDEVRERISRFGLRNSMLIAIAPTATIASIAGCYECIEPQTSNLFKRETLSGEFLQINRYLVDDLQRLGVWDEQMIAALKQSEGSVQGIPRIPEHLQSVYRTAWEIPQRALIDMAADRGAFIDQSQSLNLFMESPSISKLSSMYMHAWQRGLKTTYYLRSRPATRITPTTTSAQTESAGAAACDLENPETCDACQ